MDALILAVLCAFGYSHIVAAGQASCDSDLEPVHGDALLQAAASTLTLSRLQQEPGHSAANEIAQPHQGVEAAKSEYPGESLEQVKRSMHLAVSVMLLGFVAFVMALFYLTELKDEGVQGSMKAATWILLSATMSILLAVLMFSSTQHVLKALTGKHEGEGEAGGELDHHHGSTVAVGHEAVTRETLVLTFSRFVCFWIILQVYTYFVHEKERNLKAVAQLGSHIVAFSGMDAFGTLQEHGIFAGSLLYCLMGVVVLSGVIWIVFDLAEMGRSRIVDPVARKGWLSECRAAEHETASFILGLLSSQCIRFAITGSLPPLEGGSPMGKSEFQVHMLFVVAISLGLAVVPLEIVFNKLSYLTKDSAARSWNKGWSIRFVKVIRETLAMTMAWCLMYWGKWAFWMSTSNDGLGYGDKMTALLTTSLFMSAFCFLGMFTIECANHHIKSKSGAGLKALSEALGFVMGLSWESTFHEAVEGLGDLHLLPIGYTCNVLVLILGLVAITLPAWMLYILEKALQSERREESE